MGRPLGQRPGNKWPDEQLEYLRVLIVDRGYSSSMCIEPMTAQFPERKWTRNVIIGGVHRAGWHIKKGDDGTAKVKKRRLRKPYTAMSGLTKRSQSGHARLRQEGEPGFEVKTRRRRATQAEIEERKIGYIPQIVEDTPSTSRPMLETDVDECKWPTSIEIASMEVCGAVATIGAYCAKHAQLAYRVMPTRRRQASFNRDNREYRLLAAKETADAVLDDLVEVIGDAPDMLPAFVDVLDQ